MLIKKCHCRFFSVIVFCVAFTACSQSPTLIDQQGNEIKFSDLRGKWVIINYWASWCKPCYKEVPELNAFYLANKNQNVVMYGVSYDQVKGAQLQQIIEKMGVKFPTLKVDPAVSLGIGNVPGLPATYIFNSKGKLQKTLLGLQTRQSLAKAIGTKPRE